MRLQDLIKGLARYPRQLLGDILEDFSMTTFDGARLELKLEKDAQRTSQRFWNVSSKRTLTGILVPQKPARQCVYDISSFDVRILAEIFKSLELVDQVCFALSCKTLLAAYKDIASDKGTIPRQSTTGTYHLPLSLVNSDDEMRVKLLLQLENCRWLYCAECFLLKPRSIFTSDAVAGLPLERRCTRYDGVMKICPCIHFTRRDRNNVRLLLRSPICPSPTNYGRFEIFYDPQRCEKHVCPFYLTHNERMQVSVVISISSMGRILLCVWFSLHLPVPSEYHSELELVSPIFIFPQMNLWDLVYTTGNSTDCNTCGAFVWREPKLEEDTGTVTFITRYSLGYVDESNDRLWLNKRYNPDSDRDTQYAHVLPLIHMYIYSVGLTSMLSRVTLNLKSGS